MNNTIPKTNHRKHLAYLYQESSLLSLPIADVDFPTQRFPQGDTTATLDAATRTTSHPPGAAQPAAYMSVSTRQTAPANREHQRHSSMRRLFPSRVAVLSVLGTFPGKPRLRFLSWRRTARQVLDGCCTAVQSRVTYVAGIRAQRVMRACGNEETHGVF